MSFNSNPIQSIPYSYKKITIYKWYADLQHQWEDPSGVPDGWLYITSNEESEPYLYSLELVTPSLYNPFGSKTWMLFFGEGQAIKVRQTSSNTRTFPADADYIARVQADLAQLPAFLVTDIAYIDAFVVYDRAERIPLYNSVAQKLVLKPQIKDYFTGYNLDLTPYKLEIDLTLSPLKDGTVLIHFYYLENDTQFDCQNVKHETVNIETLRLDLKTLKPYQLKIDCVPCSISFEGDSELCNDIKTQISDNYTRCFPEGLASVKVYWNTLYEAKKNLAIANPKLIATIDLDVKPYVWAATARWGQQVINDRHSGEGVGEFIDNIKIYKKYFEPQFDGTFGAYIMPDSALIKKIGNSLNVDLYQVEEPATIGNGTEDNPQTPAQHKLDWYIRNSAGSKVNAIWKALGKDKYGTNDLDNTKDRVTNLGFLVERIAQVLGVRLNSNGKIDETLEKTTNRRLHTDGSTENDVQKFNPNCFGSEGLLVRVLPNKFSRDGIVSGGYSKVKDIPQLLAELHEQANAAVGYQEGTAIEINIDGQVYRYPNQLALLTELLITAKQTVTYSKGAFFSSLVGEQSIKEVMGGLGLRTVDKFIEFKVAGKVTKLYYKGISASQSIRRKLSAVATNVGIAIGNII